jgi:hypothetical protein
VRLGIATEAWGPLGQGNRHAHDGVAAIKALDRAGRNGPDPDTHGVPQNTLVDLQMIGAAGRVYISGSSAATARARAAITQQRRRLDQHRVAVELEQRPLDLGHGLRSGRGHALFLDDLAFGVEVAQVVRRDRAELIKQPPRQPDLVRERVSIGVQDICQHVAAVEPHRTDPRQVIEADLVDEHPLRSHAEVLGELPLEVDRHVAQPDGAMARVERRPGDDSDGVGEVDDPRVVGCELARPLGAG